MKTSKIILICGAEVNLVPDNFLRNLFVRDYEEKSKLVNIR